MSEVPREGSHWVARRTRVDDRATRRMDRLVWRGTNMFGARVTSSGGEVVEFSVATGEVVSLTQDEFLARYQPLADEPTRTDLERVREVLSGAGVVFEEQGSYRDADGDPMVTRAITEVRVASGDGPRNGGYSGLFTVLSFDASGALVEVGAWE